MYMCAFTYKLCVCSIQNPAQNYNTVACISLRSVEMEVLENYIHDGIFIRIYARNKHHSVRCLSPFSRKDKILPIVLCVKLPLTFRKTYFEYI